MTYRKSPFPSLSTLVRYLSHPDAIKSPEVWVSRRPDDLTPDGKQRRIKIVGRDGAHFLAEAENYSRPVKTTRIHYETLARQYRPDRTAATLQRVWSFSRLTRPQSGLPAVLAARVAPSRRRARRG